MGVSKNRGETPQNGWFIVENHIKMDDLGAHPYFLETPICVGGDLQITKQRIVNGYTVYTVVKGSMARLATSSSVAICKGL